MFTRIRAQIIRPWIKRPRGIALLLATCVILTNSSAFAQRGGAGCAGMSGTSGGSTGTGSFGTGSFGTSGGVGVAGGFNGTAGSLNNPVHMMIADQQMQAMQNAYGFPMMFDSDNYNVDPRTKKAMRGEKATLSKKRQETRQAKQTQSVATRMQPRSAS